MALQDYSEDPDQNGLVLGIDIGEDCPADNLNNGMRKIMSDIATWVKGAVFTGLTKIRDAAGDTGNAILRFTNNAGSTTLGFVQGLVGGGLAFGHGSTEIVRITPTGRVGILTDSPNYPLDLNGDGRLITLRFRNNGAASLFSDAANLRLTGDTGDFYNYDCANNLHEFFIGGTRRGYVDGAGRVVAATEIIASTLVRAGGFTNFFMNYNGGNPYLNFDNGDYIQLDAANNHFNVVLNGANRMSVGVNGLAMAGASFLGSGTLNALGLYQNGQGVAAIAAQSLGNPGYMVLSNGFRIMWGTGTAPANGAVNVNYPTAFASFSIPLVSGGLNINNADENYAAVIQGSSSTTGFSVINSYSAGHSFYWIAVGV